jgi:ATP-dependent DNA helicase RecG
VRTNDGFEIADVDLKLRGPGDLQGTQQSGTLDLKLADLSKDVALLQIARTAAIKLLAEDPELTLPENQVVLNYFTNQGKQQINWSRIS